LGWLNYQKGNLDRAEELIKAALVGDPGSTSIRAHLGMVYARQGKTQEAIQEFTRIIKTSPQSPEAENARRMVKSLSKK
jgi:Tfp pilus assembly protein PilF